MGFFSSLFGKKEKVPDGTYRRVTGSGGYERGSGPDPYNAAFRSDEDAFDLVLVTADGRVLVTAGLADRFTPSEDSGYAYETVS